MASLDNTLYIYNAIFRSNKQGSLFSAGEVDDVESLASIFGCRVALLSMKHLGLPLGASYKSTSIWSVIVEKMGRCLVG